MTPQQQAAIFLLVASAAVSIHQRLVSLLATPDVAVIVLCSGILFIFLECNLPGAIIPGALGSLLLLSSIYGLSLLPLRPAALLALLGACALLALSTRVARRGLSTSAAICGITYGLSALVDQTRSASRVHLPVAVCAGLLLGASASFLGLVAVKARRNKAFP